MLEDLYQQVILDSSRSTKNRGDLVSLPTARNVVLNNPLCGDSVDLWVDVQAGLIQDVRFLGNGCSISQASASLLADLTRGKSIAEVKLLAQDFRKMLEGRAKDDELAHLGNLVALEGVKRFPARARCAMLAFEALEKVLARFEMQNIESATKPENSHGSLQQKICCDEDCGK